MYIPTHFILDYSSKNTFRVIKNAAPFRTKPCLSPGLSLKGTREASWNPRMILLARQLSLRANQIWSPPHMPGPSWLSTWWRNLRTRLPFSNLSQEASPSILDHCDERTSPPQGDVPYCGCWVFVREQTGMHEGDQERRPLPARTWLNDEQDKRVFWLNGLAGTGKSTIAQTFAETSFADGKLGASFFCSRNFDDRSNLRTIFPTLAFQLAHRYPALPREVDSGLDREPRRWPGVPLFSNRETHCWAIPGNKNPNPHHH
jgi:hypothetical protein